MSRSKKHSHKQSPEEKALTVVCPKCGVWEDKPCKFTAGDNKGKKRSKPHRERIALAANGKKKSKAVVDVEYPEDPKTARLRKAKEKLTDEQRAVVKVISEKIEILGKAATFVGPVTKGPIVSTYRFLPERRTKVTHLETLRKDIAVSLGAEDVLIKRMPGEQAVGFFVPNKDRQKVDFRETLQAVTSYMQEETSDGHKPIPLNFGVDSNGEPYVDDLTTLPHLLVAGTTGGGKSTWLHGAVDSICWTMAPSEVQMYISDTKGVEFRHFQKLPHLRAPISTNLYTTMQYFSDCIEETQRRLDLFGMANVRNIHEYNELQPDGKKMAYIVFVIDELADLMGTSLERSEAKMNSDKLSTLVARSRASGIHVIAATQRPDVKQIKGSIKANFPARLSFRLPSQADSKTILNTKGAEALMSRGDMLYVSSMSPDLKRLHASWMSLEDSKKMIEFIVQRHAVEEIPEVQVGTTSEKKSTLTWKSLQ